MGCAGYYRPPNSIKHIYRFDRLGERERWEKHCGPKGLNGVDQRKLLWHGSAVQNFKSILTDGLKIVRMSEIFFSDAAQKRLVIFFDIYQFTFVDIFHRSSPESGLKLMTIMIYLT